MLINIKKIIGLPVETQSKESLGKVIDINLDIENHVIIEYVVKHGFLNSGQLFIKPMQVIKITVEKMIVEDAVLKDLEELKEAKMNSNQLFANVSQTKID